MIKTFKYRIYPTKAQESKLENTLRLCRNLYNSALEQRITAWYRCSKSLSCYDQQAELPPLKKEFTEYNQVNAQVLQNVLARLDKAYNSFFRRVKEGEKAGFPRFRGRNRYSSFCYPQSGFGVSDKSIYLAKIGNVRIVLHRPIVGKIKTCTVSRSATGKWYVTLACEFEPEYLPVSPNSVGIDVGLKSFATLSTGETIGNPRFFRTDEKALAKVQRRHSKHKTKKTRKAVARVHERIKFRRHNFSHQESRKIINENQFIAVEDLAITRMVKNHNLAKSIGDASWSQFTTNLAYKAEWAGRQFIAVNPAYTSRDCSRCRHRQKMPLSERMYNCPCCGLLIDRDWNASLNILGVGLHAVGLTLDVPLCYSGK